MEKPNFAMMKSGFRFLCFNLARLLGSFPDKRLMKIRANQCVICCRVIFKGLIGRKGGKT